MKALNLNKFVKVVALGLVSLSMVGGSFAYMGHPGPNPNGMNKQQFSNESNLNTSGIGQDDVVKESTLQYVLQLPKQTLDEQEKEGLLHMREEEKLARDVYLTLYEKWKLPIFRNIARSEQNHMNAVKVLLDKYSLEDPVEQTHDEVGKFVNPEIQELYNKLVEEGSQSLENALKVGATIEDLDIKDLEDYVAETDNNDIKTVYNNLMKGSRNHLRAFTSQLERRYGETYHCQFISEEECQSIINSDWERGIFYGPENKPLFNRTPMYHNRNQMMNNNQFGQRGQGRMGEGMNGSFGLRIEQGGFGHGQMGRGQGKGHGGHFVDINFIKQNKHQFMLQVKERLKQIRQEIEQVKRKVMMEIRERKRLDPQTKQEVLMVIKQTLMVKLQLLLADVVDTPLENTYAPKIQELINKLQNANDINTLKEVVYEYLKLKREVKMKLRSSQ